MKMSPTEGDAERAGESDAGKSDVCQTMNIMIEPHFPF